MSISLWPHGLYSSWNSPGQNTAVGSLSLLQGIFPTQGSHPDLSHCKWILYQLSHNWSPRILEWVAYPFSRGSSLPRNRTGVSCIAGGLFTYWTIREALFQERSFGTLDLLNDLISLGSTESNKYPKFYKVKRIYFLGFVSHRNHLVLNSALCVMWVWVFHSWNRSWVFESLRSQGFEFWGLRILDTLAQINDELMLPKS